MADAQIRPQLVAAILLVDDEDLLPETLENLAHLVDSVCIVNATSGLVDKKCLDRFTIEAQVIDVQWNDDLAALRNMVIQRYRNDWIVWLEPGEQLHCEPVDILRTALLQAPTDCAAMRVLVQAPVEKTGDIEQCEELRIVRATEQLYYTGRIGESVEPSLQEAGYKILVAPAVITTGLARVQAQRKNRRAERIVGIFERHLASGLEQDHDNRLLSTLLATGEAYAQLGQYEQARQCFRRAVNLAQPGSVQHLAAYYGLLAAFDEDESQPLEKSLAICLEALQHFPLDAQLLCAMGNYAQRSNRLDLAIRCFESAYRHGLIESTCWHLRDIKPLAASCWSLCLLLQGRQQEAIQVLEQALEENPQSDRLQERLLEQYVKAGRKEDALQLLEKFSFHQQRDALRLAVEGACLVNEGQLARGLAALQAAYLSGCDDPICLRWLISALIAAGQPQAASPVLEKWLTVDPVNPEAKLMQQLLEQALQEQQQAETGPQEQRTLRIDPAASHTEVLMPQFPIVSQFSSESIAAAPPDEFDEEQRKQ